MWYAIERLWKISYYSSNKIIIIHVQPPFFQKSNKYMPSIIVFSISCNEKWKMVIHILNKHIFQKLDTEYLLSVCLPKGETLANFASCGNFNKLLLIALDNRVLKISAHNWTNSGGILSIPINFSWSMFFKSFFTCSEETNAWVLLCVGGVDSVKFLLISFILWWFSKVY